MTRIWYASEQDVKRSADIPSTADLDDNIARALDEGSQAVDDLCRRYFYPISTVHYFPWPQDINQPSNTLYLNKHGLIELDELTNGDGAIIPPSQYDLGPKQYGPPFTKITVAGSFSTNAMFPDRSIRGEGTYGYQIDEKTVTQTINQLTGTSVTLVDGSAVGVGSLIRIGTERLVVAAKGGWVDSENVAAIILEAKKSADRFTVTDGAAFHVGEEILMDSEVMRIQRIAGNRLIVKRAVDGSVLEEHSTDEVLVDRHIRVERSVLGSSAFDTAADADVHLFKFPPRVSQLARAEALTIMGFDIASYATSTGQGDADIKHSTKPLEDLRNKVFQQYGRMRVGAA